MKSKKLVIILCILAFITVLIVINSTLFTLQSVSINWLTSKYILDIDSVKDYNITDKVDVGGSIFLVQKDEITSKLEKSFPYLRVVSIETKFPNKLVLHTAERESLYAVKLSSNEYAILDELGKVLNLSTYESIFEGAGADLGTRPILVNFESISINEKDFVIGEEVSSEYVKYILKSMSYSLRETSYIPATSKGVLKSIDITSQGDTSFVSIKTRNGMVLNVNEFENYTTDKLLLAFERYNALHNEGVVDCTIEVWYCNNTNKIFADIIW